MRHEGEKGTVTNEYIRKRVIALFSGVQTWRRERSERHDGGEYDDNQFQRYGSWFVEVGKEQEPQF